MSSEQQLEPLPLMQDQLEVWKLTIGARRTHLRDKLEARDHNEAIHRYLRWQSDKLADLESLLDRVWEATL